MLWALAPSHPKQALPNKARNKAIKNHSTMFVLFMTFDVLTQFIIKTKYRGSQHKELSAHHQHTSGDVMVRADNERREREADSRQETADGDS